MPGTTPSGATCPSGSDARILAVRGNSVTLRVKTRARSVLIPALNVANGEAECLGDRFFGTEAPSSVGCLDLPASGISFFSTVRFNIIPALPKRLRAAAPVLRPKITSGAVGQRTA